MQKEKCRRASIVNVLLLILCLSAKFGNCRQNFYRDETLSFLTRISKSRLTRSTRSLGSNSDEPSTEPFLKMVEELHDVSVESEGKAVFKCKVQAYPKKNITFTWFKDNDKLDPTDSDQRFIIRTRARESRLVINDAFSSDSGRYRCEVSNIERRVISSANLHVGFNMLPEDSNADFDDAYLKGSCEKYQGHACAEYLESGCFYKESFQDQNAMEQDMMNSLSALTAVTDISKDCLLYTEKAFCVYLFPPCREGQCETEQHDPQPLRLCREDCELLKYDVCKDDFARTSNELVLQIMDEANCTHLPPTTTPNRECTSVGLPRVVNPEQTCYSKDTESYRGTLSISFKGHQCQAWPDIMKSENPELSGGHSFCRNPGDTEDTPWCYVEKNGVHPEKCEVPSCEENPSTSDIVMIIIPAVSVPILIGCFLLVFCFACRRRKTSTPQHTKGFQLETKGMPAVKVNAPELNANVVQLIGDIGDGKFGKVTKAKILRNLQYCPSEPVAVKTLQERANSQQARDFQLEMTTFSSLQHANVGCLKAIVTEKTFHCMIFEYTSGCDLHEYLVSHSPQADFAKPPSSASSHCSTIMEYDDFIRMAIQVTAGMEYLTRNNFIHRDLAARNILVCGNMELKISNLGVVRDSYLSCYYRSPQGGQMLPIRWMAPESIQSGKFSDKSTVWSFGILLWEMFNYGSQPYCGYSNQEVLEMIPRGHLLTCPDQCPAKMYSLMQECWSLLPQHRPEFKDLHAKLAGWEGTSTTRMTSHLAQGIHRQLGVMKEQPGGQFVQYGPPQSKMMNDYTYGLPPPVRYSGSAPTPPPAVDFGRNYSVPNEPRMYNGGNYIHNPHSNSQNHFPTVGYSPGLPPTNSGPPSRSSGSIVSGELHPHHGFRVNNLPSHQEMQEPAAGLPPPPHSYYPPSSDRSSRTVAENLSDHGRPGVYVNIEKSSPNQTSSSTGDDNFNRQHSRPSSRMRADGSYPLAVYREPGASDGGNCSPSFQKPALAPKPPSYQQASGDEHMRPNNLNPPMLSNNTNRGQSNESKSAEVKARSCDSGLPNDDVDSEGADSHRPLLVVNSSNLHRPSQSLKYPPSSMAGSG